MKTLPITDDAHWHALRAQHIGGSEIAALFDLSPYFTRFMIWHAKAAHAPLPEPDHDRIWWGKKLEPIIAERIAADMRWSLEERKVYCQADDVDGMGCTVDRFIVDHEQGPGIVEIKDVDWLMFRQDWTETKAPDHIELQLQHQLAVTGYGWGAIGVFIKGSSNEIRIYERRPHAPTIDRIKAAVAEFWASVRASKAPDPFGVAVELDTLAQLFSPPEPEIVADLTGDAAAFEAARMFEWARGQVSFHQKVVDEQLVTLLHKIGNAKRIELPGFDIRRAKNGPIYRCRMREGAEAPVATATEHAFI